MEMRGLCSLVGEGATASPIPFKLRLTKECAAFSEVHTSPMVECAFLQETMGFKYAVSLSYFEYYNV